MKDDEITRYFDQVEEVSQYILRDIHREVIKKRIKITPGQFVVMKKLYNRGSLTVSEVAEDLHVSLSAITALVDRLYRCGYVIRRRNERDRRMVNLELTEAGKQVTKTCETIRYKVMKKYISKLDDTDIFRLIKINEKLLQIVKDLRSAGEKQESDKE